MLQTLLNFILTKTPIFYWTQSLWRDEAFSVWIAKDSVWSVINRTAGDFNPPLYYLFLHYWMNFLGNTEIAARGLSVLFYLVFLFTVNKFARKIFKSEKWVIITTLLAAFNPMLLYYAFELRMYALFYLLATLSMYFLFVENWTGYILASALGLYTQPFMFLLLAAQIPYFLFNKKLTTGIKCALGILLLYLPWIPVIISQFKQSGPMWIYPVDLNLILASLGNLYTGYEGTPGNLWKLMQLLSLIIVLVSFWLIKSKQNRKIIFLVLSWVYIPLTLVLAYSLKKPIFVNRYLIFIAAGEIFLISLYLYQIKNKRLQNLLIFIFLGLSVWGNYWAIDFHRKINIRQTFAEIAPILKTLDVIYAGSPLVFFESLYYAPANSKVYLYNPEKLTMPKYVGSDGMKADVWQPAYPKFPQRAFLIKESGGYIIVSQTEGLK